MVADIVRAVAGAFFIMAVMVLPARTIDLAHRHVPFLVSDNGVLSGTLQSRFIPGAKSVLVKPVITGEAATQLYALYVPGASATTVTVNGARLHLQPLERQDGLVYLVDSRNLQVGENTFRFDKSLEQSWAGLALFSLRNTYEEVHFADAFSESPGVAELGTREFPASALQTSYDVLWYECTWVPSVPTTVGIPAYMQTGSQVIMGARALVAGLQVIELDFDMNPAGNGGPPMVIDYIDSGEGTASLGWTYVSSSVTPRLRVTLPTQISQAGTEFQIRIGYHGAPNTDQPKEIFNRNSLYAEMNSGGRPVVYSVSQPYGARRWWPCKDHPSDKPTTTVQRIIVPKRTGYTLTAVSNGTLHPVLDHGSTLEYVWENHYPIATYLMSMAISNYIYRGGTYTSRDGQAQMPVGSYIYPNDEDFEGNGYLGTIQVMNFFADTFGEYPFLDEKYVTAAWNISWAIEHQTATSMPGGLSEGLADGLTRRNVHELAHQWFGDKVTAASWDHLWLNEGFATYAEALFFEHYIGKWRYHEIVDDWRPSSRTPVVGPDTDEFAGSVAYDRGAWILHMLRFVLGDEAFFQVLRDYAATGYHSALSQPGNGDAAVDFQTLVEQSAGLAPGSMQQFFAQWLYSPNANYDDRPSYSYSAAYDVNTSSVLVRVSQSQGGVPFFMPVRIGLVASDNSTTQVRLPAGSSQATFPLRSFVPVVSEFDPENWVLNYLAPSIVTASLPPAITGTSYAYTLQTAGVSGSTLWQKLSGPPWLSINSAGTINGVPPVTGIYPISVRLTSSGVSVDASFDLIAVNGTLPPTVVINELLYENLDGADNAEYVELLNTSASPVDISGWQIVPVSSATGEPVNAATIPAGTTLQPGSYYVAGNAAPVNAVYGNVVNFNTNWFESLPDGPAAIVLKSNLGVRVDSVAYRSDTAFSGGSYSSMALAEGGTGRAISAAITATSENAVLGRLPDGKDSGNNLRDFALVPPSPGQANSGGVTLPFFDDFNSGPRPEWRPAFDNPVRTATPGQPGKPPIPAPAPAGGDVVEVFDETGGGDVIYLPGAFDKLNVEGYLWIPHTRSASLAWSTGIGIATTVESAWFSSSASFGLENGFYLEYQNGPELGLKNGAIPNGPDQVRLIAADSSSCPGFGPSGFSAQILGIIPSVSSAQWLHFRMFFDKPANRLYASLEEEVIYNGLIPAGGYNTAGGVTIGFREEHPGSPSSANVEGTWLDNIKIDADTSLNTRVNDYFLY